MNIQPSVQNPAKVSPGLDRKVGKTMISMIDRKRIFIFVAITYGLSITMGLVIFLGGGMAAPQANELLAVTMFAPLIAHIATRLITREGWSNNFLRMDFRRGRWRYYLAAWFLPFMASLVGGAIYYLLFPGQFDPSMTSYRELGLNSIGSTMAPWAFFITQLGISIVSPFSEALILSFGEEFGWRAYLLPKLMPLSPRKAVLLVGAIWGVWHWPAILTGFNYGLGYWGAPLVGPLLFVVAMIFESFIYAWVTLRSGSVWPAALLHGASNASNTLVSIFFSGNPNPLIGPGAQGIIGMLGYAVLALLIFVSPRALAPIDGSRTMKLEAIQVAHQPTEEYRIM